MVQIVSRDDDNQAGAEIDRRQQLRLKCDGSPEDVHLMDLILAVWDAPAESFKRALHELKAAAAIDRGRHLRLMCDGSPEDKELMKLILAVWDAPLPSPNRTRDNLIRPRAIHALILYVQDIIKNYWRDHQQEQDTPVVFFYRDAELEPLAYLSQHIDEFVPTTGKSIKTCLIGWLKCKSINRLKDKHRAHMRQRESDEISSRSQENPSYTSRYTALMHL